MSRPILHFTAETGWINDPHGITYRDGGYHLFFQYVPGSLVWAPNCHWGHATGPDLLSQQEGPIAIAPGDGDDGIWTGSLVTDAAGRSTVFYTSVSVPDIGIGRVRVARPFDEGWQVWEKGSIVASKPEELEITAYRDPFVFRDGDRWRMFLGAALADGTAVALGYESTDLEEWRYYGIAAQRSTAETDPVWTGALWECPQLFEIDGRHVMVTSVWDDDVLHYAAYGVGSYRDGVFVADSWGQLSYGQSYYAPSFFRDAAGAPSLMFWMRGVADADAGWAGALSVPYSLRLDGDVLIAEPHPDVDAHRGARVQGAFADAASGALELAGSAADLEWAAGPNGRILVASGAGEGFSLAVGDAGLTLSVPGRGDSTVPYRGGAIRIIVDGPLVEVSSELGIVASAIRAASGALVVTGDVGSVAGWVLDPAGSGQDASASLVGGARGY